MAMVSAQVLRQIVAEAQAKNNLEGLAMRVLDLQTADKFRLAAMLLDQNLVSLAVHVGKRALQEIELATALASAAATCHGRRRDARQR